MQIKIKYPEIEVENIKIKDEELQIKHINELQKELDSKLDKNIPERLNLITGFLDTKQGDYKFSGNLFRYNTLKEKITFFEGQIEYTLNDELSIEVQSNNGGTYIYINPKTMTLFEMQGFHDLDEHVLLGWVLMSDGNIIWVGRETHSQSRNIEWHKTQHQDIGQVWRYGGGLSYDSNAKITINTPLTIADEDLVHTINNLGNGNSLQDEYVQDLSEVDLPVLMRNGSKWGYSQTDGLQNKYITTSLQTLGDDKYQTYFVIYTNDIVLPVKLVMPNEFHDDLQDAINLDFKQLGLEVPEIIPAYKIIIKGDSSVPRGFVIEEALKIVSRTPQLSKSETNAPETHSQLYDRGEPDQHPIQQITGLSSQLDSKVPKTTTINSKQLINDITLDTSDIQDTNDKRYMTESQINQLNSLDTNIETRIGDHIKQETGDSQSDTMSQKQSTENFLNLDKKDGAMLYIQETEPVGAPEGSIWIKI